MDGLSEILVKFSSCFKEDRPKNLFLLPSFANPVLEVDGIHLTPYSGFQFVIDLFDQAEEIIINSRKPAATVMAIQHETVRVLEDRVCVLEQDHQRLNKSVEARSVVSSEAFDYAENQR